MTGYWFFFGVGFGAPVVGDARRRVPRRRHRLPPRDRAARRIGVLPHHPRARVRAARERRRAARAHGSARRRRGARRGECGARVADAGNFTPFLPHGWAGVGIAISLFVWAFAGWEAITHIAGEFKNPRRTIPLATAIAVVVVGAAYLALQFATVAVLGAGGGSGVVPLIDLVAITMPGFGPAIVAGHRGHRRDRRAQRLHPCVRKPRLHRSAATAICRAGSPGAPSRERCRAAALLLTAVLCIGYTLAFFFLHLDLEVFVLIHTSSMVAVYLLGMIAAVRLLERWSVGWWMAIISCVLVAGLVVLAGANLLIPAHPHGRRPRRRRSSREGVPLSVEKERVDA